jgi:hypothetical protein
LFGTNEARDPARDNLRDPEQLSAALRILQAVVEARPPESFAAIFTPVRNCVEACLPCDRTQIVQALEGMVAATLRAIAATERVAAGEVLQGQPLMGELQGAAGGPPRVHP